MKIKVSYFLSIFSHNIRKISDFNNKTYLPWQYWKFQTMISIFSACKQVINEILNNNSICFLKDVNILTFSTTHKILF